MTAREVSSERVSEERLERILDNARHEFLAADTQVMCQYWQDRIDIYTELLALRSSVKTVGVKKLEWSIEQRSGFNIHVGRGLGLKYEAAIKAYNPGWIVTLGESDVIFDGTDVGEEEAKAAAQADYESRVLSALARPAPQEAPSEVTDIMVQKAWEAYDANGGYSKPERFRAAIIAAMKGRSPMTVETEGQYGSFTPISVGVGTSALNSEGLEKAVAQAIFDPGATEGYKGDRTLTEWQVQAVMRAITYHTPALPPVDGLEVVAWDVAPKGLPAEPTKSHSFVAEIERQGGSITPLTRLSQASSVIAGLKAEIDDLRDEWQAEYDARLAANTARRAADARISSLEEENKRQREALEQPFAMLFLDGRNKHGTHVIPLPLRSLPDEFLDGPELEEMAEQIMSEAEKLGFSECDAVWTEFRWNDPQIGDDGRVELAGYWEFSRIIPEVSRKAETQTEDHNG